MKLQSINPHDQSIIGELKISTPEEITSAVQKARRAFETWQYTSIQERISYIQKYKGKIIQQKEKIAKLIAQEMGKPLNQCLEEVDMEIVFLNYYTGKGPEALSDEGVHQEKNKTYRIVYEPYGVCVCIAPWNYPLSMFHSGVIPALIAGNTVVFKPSEYTSLSQKMFTDLLLSTKIPEGVLQIVIGAGNVGEVLVEQEMDLVWFTGSTKIGQKIYAKCGEKFIKCLAEMGGSSAGIVFADADLEKAVENIYFSRFSCNGQVCNAVKRLFIEKSVYQKFIDKMGEKLKTISIGDPMKNTDIGPLVSKKQLIVLENQVQDAIKKGAKVLIGGKRPEQKDLQKGNYYEPTILENVTLDMKVMNEETFGTVLPIMQFENEKEVVDLANNTIYGLANEVYTSNVQKAERIARKLKSGVVAINTTDYFKPTCPFGGYKKSGIGREYGKIGMQEFAQVKLLVVENPS